MITRILDRAAVAMALLGGAVLIVLIVMICISVAGSGLAQGFDWAGPVKGEFEVVEAALAFAIFAFLPLTQLRGAHPSVTVFSDLMGPRATHWLAAFWETVFAAVLILIAWRLAIGTLDKACVPQRFTGAWCSVEISFRLGFPLWWSYAASLVAAVQAAITAIWCAGLRLRRGALPPKPDLHGSL